MRRFTLIGLTAMAVLVAAIAASSASAVIPEILPSAGAGGRTYTGAQEGALSILIGPEGVKVECTAATGTGTQGPNDTPLGLFHILFKGCTTAAGAKKCTGLNELTAGEILALGTWHLWWDRETGGSFSLTVATIFLTELLHFSCGAALLAEVMGEVVCLDLKPEEKNKTHSFHCIPKLNAKSEPEPAQKEEYCENETGGTCTWIVPKLLISSNHGAFKEASELALGNVTTTEETFADSL